MAQQTTNHSASSTHCISYYMQVMLAIILSASQVL